MEPHLKARVPEPPRIEPAPCEHERAIARALSCPLAPAPPPVTGWSPPTHSLYARDLVPGPCDGDGAEDLSGALERPGQSQGLERDVGDGSHG